MTFVDVLDIDFRRGYLPSSCSGPRRLVTSNKSKGNTMSDVSLSDGILSGSIPGIAREPWHRTVDAGRQAQTNEVAPAFDSAPVSASGMPDSRASSEHDLVIASWLREEHHRSPFQPTRTRASANVDFND
jgi:hypothetical protein